MKKLILIAGLLLLSGIIYSQNLKYSEVKIFTDHAGIEQLGTLGLPIEEGFHAKDGSWTIILSETEIAKVINAGFKFEIIRDDYTAWIQQRNKEYKKKTIAATYVYPVPNHFEQGSMGGFYTLEEVQNELDSMRYFYPSLISVKAQAGTTTSIFGRPLYFVRISNNPDVNQDKPKILYNALHHAREPMGMQQLMFFMWYLLENYSTSEEIQYLVNNLEIYFIPVVNPDGYNYNDSIEPDGGGMWRKNRRNNGGGYYGVDLNRNYSYKWGYEDVGSSPYPYDETYRGTSAFSEPETQIIRDFCIEKNFLMAMNYHTYGDLLLYPWGYETQITPDSTLELNYAGFFTKENGYNSGTPGEILYNTNGDAADWQYGEQTLKSKVFAFSPEIGSSTDGFWPSPDRIIPLAEENIYCNLMMAHFALRYAEVKRASPIIIPEKQGYFIFSFKRYGIDSLADYTISIEPLDTTQIISIGSPKVISNPVQFQTYSDSISYTLSPDTPAGTEFKYVLSVYNGLYTFHDTIIHYYGTPLIILSDNCNDMSRWTSNRWDISHSQYHSPDASITDSPSGNYLPNSNNSVTTINSFDLNETPVAVLEFWAKWNIEKGFDYTQVKISDDNGSSWTPLAGEYTHPGSVNQVPGQPLYDGKKYMWIKEEILLNEYLGKQIMLRFTLVSDVWANYDGYYFDDLSITKIDMTTGLTSSNPKTEYLLSEPLPNPAVNQVRFHYSLPAGVVNAKLVIMDIRGVIYKKAEVTNKTGLFSIDLNEFLSGMYFCTLESSIGASITRKLVIIK